jgi:hypothetical protein
MALAADANGFGFTSAVRNIGEEGRGNEAACGTACDDDAE